MKFLAGQIILRSAPFGAALDIDFLERACSYCLTCKPKLSRCIECTVVHYCSDKCQDADAVDHRIECDALRRVAPWVPTSEIRLLCRVWTRSRRETTAPSQEVVLGRTRTFVGLMTHRESRALEFMQNVFKEIGSQVNRFLCERDQPDEESLLTVFLKLDINSHKIMSWDGTIGCALFLGGSVFNHACAPDHRIAYYFDGGHFVIKAMENLEVNSPEDINISYVPSTLPRELRRIQLKEKYFFDCACRRCLGQEVVVSEASEKLVKEAQQLRARPDTKQKLIEIKEFLASPSIASLANNDYTKLVVTVGLFGLYGTLEMPVDAVRIGEQLTRTYRKMDIAAVDHLYLICQMFTAALNAGWFDKRNPNHSKFLRLLNQAHADSQKIFGPGHYHSKLIASIYDRLGMK
ncbi:histone-lysine N-methyltransferase SMYD3-like [Varroa jacobsoni]|uniref:histone-lysine N-methyltransferase SMYD3-like n=1 Tax=Varroa jacobsoni TaxID=62625 RepID=UPI000BF3F01E|nr:histone-lysine N-methyltransferase SMYD3-like [Varroa jacobsoni]